MVSHRTLEGRGLEIYDPAMQHHSITLAGRQFLAQERERGEVAQQLIPAPILPPAQVFPEYRRANEAPATQPREPFAVDPNVVDRALGAHAATQNALAAWLIAKGHTPLRSGASAADFDLAWDTGAAFYVGEVKSLTQGNEIGQLRL